MITFHDEKEATGTTNPVFEPTASWGVRGFEDSDVFNLKEKVTGSTHVFLVHDADVYAG